jgi:hypothetical protein
VAEGKLVELIIRNLKYECWFLPLVWGFRGKHPVAACSFSASSNREVLLVAQEFQNRARLPFSRVEKTIKTNVIY